ncbi:hypothetical protein [Kordiimonas sp. SCSIO 12610]|uniref:hypothetical protein n=1 Tax=Kordiimonas sp. SCSIO 12610 TaxID=2829597 RepID=UPI00210A2E2E|nr:hypothetical protein [Kordiimonas sp. SCSIO 12610]UTW56140.1 hypothetical protein KFF44_04385 [Kordiimonas sp. SCSIO 12610]
MKLELGKADLILIIGAILTTVGAFSPMLNIAGLQNVSYADAADPEVYLLILLAIAAAVLAAVNMRKFALFPAIGAWIVMLWPILKNMGGGSDDDGGLLGKITDAVSDPLQKVTEQLFSNVFDFEWGGYAFLIGMVLVLVGGIMTFLSARKA